ncbi:unnamed protein product [Ixodes persulcatus]
MQQGRLRNFPQQTSPRNGARHRRSGSQKNMSRERLVDLPCAIKDARLTHFGFSAELRTLHAALFMQAGVVTEEPLLPLTGEHELQPNADAAFGHVSRALSHCICCPHPCSSNANGLGRHGLISSPKRPFFLSQRCFLAVRRIVGLPLEEVLRRLQKSKRNEDIEDIKRSTRDQATSSLWMRHIVGMITASIAYSVYTRVQTLTTKMGPHTLRPLLRKISRQTNVPTAAMRRGSDLEGPAKCYERKHFQHEDLVVRGCGLFFMEGVSYIGASPDGLVECKCCANPVLEVKYREINEEFFAREHREGHGQHSRKTEAH